MNKNNWDENLESEAQKNMARLVSELPDEEVSMAWRSELNQKLLAMQQPKRKSFISRFWMPVSGLAVASVFAVMLINQPVTSTEEPTFSQSLLNAHKQVVAANEMGTLQNAEEASNTSFETVPLNENQDLMPL